MTDANMPERIWITSEDHAASWSGSFRRFVASDLDHGDDYAQYVRSDLCASGQQVRALVWSEGIAETSIGTFCISPSSNGQYSLMCSMWPGKRSLHESEEAAVVAAQAFHKHCILAALTPAPEAAQTELINADEAWQDLLEKDDRTSPEEYPDMALITRDELAGYMASPPVAQTEAVAWHYCPECGSENVRWSEGQHKQCECGQEWFSDLDYSVVVRKHLAEWFSAPAAQDSVREAMTDRAIRDYAREHDIYVREHASCPDIKNGGWIHPFSLTISGDKLRDMIRALAGKGGA